MNAPLIVDDLVRSLKRRYGKPESFGRSRLFKFGDSLSCSVNYSKILPGPRYFFGVSREVVDPDFQYPETTAGEFVLLICGSIANTLVLPRALVFEMLSDVPTRRIDIFHEDGAYILQTTKHPKLNVSEFLNAFPKINKGEDNSEETAQFQKPDRNSLKGAVVVNTARASRRVQRLGSPERPQSFVPTRVICRLNVTEVTKLRLRRKYPPHRSKY